MYYKKGFQSVVALLVVVRLKNVTVKESKRMVLAVVASGFNAMYKSGEAYAS